VRLRHDLNVARREQVERTALRTVGACFIALAMYILYESSSLLVGRDPPERSIAGIVIASISVIVMPLLAQAMHADSKQADFCSFLSAILLGGLLLNALFGWWCTDHCEGRHGLRAEACCDRCVLR
jgi:divalent metal cation (Fe/Co/Zn/Cd) transporter